MKLLDGKIVKKTVLAELKEKVSKEKRPLGLVVIQVGEDPANVVYVRQKAKMAEKVGFNFNHVKLDSSVSEEELLNKIDEFNNIQIAFIMEIIDYH